MSPEITSKTCIKNIIHEGDLNTYSFSDIILAFALSSLVTIANERDLNTAASLKFSMLLLSIYFFLCGFGLMILGVVGRIRISRLSSELVPEFEKFEYIDLGPLLISYYNSVIIAGIPLFCLGITLIKSWDAFIINLIIWIGFLIYTDFTYRKVKKILKPKGMTLKTLYSRIKDGQIFKLEAALKNQKFQDDDQDNQKKM